MADKGWSSQIAKEDEAMEEACREHAILTGIDDPIGYMDAYHLSCKRMPCRVGCPLDWQEAMG